MAQAVQAVFTRPPQLEITKAPLLTPQNSPNHDIPLIRLPEQNPNHSPQLSPKRVQQISSPSPKNPYQELYQRNKNVLQIMKGPRKNEVNRAERKPDSALVFLLELDADEAEAMERNYDEPSSASAAPQNRGPSAVKVQRAAQLPFSCPTFS